MQEQRSLPLEFRDHLIFIMKTSLQRGDELQKRTTAQSLVYRKRAASVARLAEAEHDQAKMMPLIQEALSWIQIAENEEVVAEAQTNGSC